MGAIASGGVQVLNEEVLASPRLGLVDLAVDVGKLLLHVATCVPDALVVDRRPELADEEVEQALGAKVADRFVELGVEVRGDGAEQGRAAVIGQSDAHRAGVYDRSPPVQGPPD